MLFQAIQNRQTPKPDLKQPCTCVAVLWSIYHLIHYHAVHPIWITKNTVSVPFAFVPSKSQDELKRAINVLRYNKIEYMILSASSTDPTNPTERHI